MKRIIIIGLLWSMAQTMVGQYQISNTADLMKIAEEKNRDLQIASARAESDRFSRNITRGNLLPQVKLYSTLDYNYALPVQLIPAEVFGGKPGDFRQVQFGTNYNFNAGLEATLPIINVSLWSDVAIGTKTYKAGLMQADVQKYELNKQLLRAYYITLITGESLKISEQNAMIADSLMKLAEYRYKQGNLELLEYNRAKNTALSVLNTFEQNKFSYLKNKNNLKLMIGLNPEDTLQLTEMLTPSVSTNISVEPFDEQSYSSVKYKKLQIGIQNSQVRRDKYKFLPEMNTYIRYSKQSQKNDLDFFASNTPWFSIGVLGARIDWNIFNGFGKYNAVRRSQQRLKIAELEYENEKYKVRNEYEEHSINYASAMKQCSILAENKKIVDENLKIAEVKYNNGVYTYDQYLTIFNDQLNIQNQYLKAIADMYTYKSILEIKNR